MTDDITLKLLNWYDSEKRILPWRNLDRKKIDPKCTIKETKLNDYSGGNATFLDRHEIDCGDNILNDITLNKVGNNLSYSYICCDGEKNVGKIFRKTRVTKYYLSRSRKY